MINKTLSYKSTRDTTPSLCLASLHHFSLTAQHLVEFPALTTENPPKSTEMSKPAEPKMLADLKREHSSAPSAAASDSSDSLPTLSRTSTGELMSTTVTLSKPDSDDASSTAAGEAAPGSGVGGGDHTQRISTTIEHEAPAKIKVDQEKGQLHLFSKKRAPKVKRLVTFRPQLSSFDRFNPSTSVDLFRGFYTLFWIFLAIMVLRTGIRSWKQERTIIGLSFARLIGGDGIVLALSDLALVASTVLCVPFMQLVEKGYIPYHWTGLLLQHIGQALFLASAITWVRLQKNPPLSSLAQANMHARRHSSVNGTGSNPASSRCTPSP